MQVRQLHGKSFIGKESIASTAKPFKAFNPKTYESIEPTFYEADPNQVDLAVSKADTAFRTFQKKSPSEVSTFLKEISSELSQNTRQILDRGMLETGYPEPRLQGELTRTINQINMFSKLVEEGSYVDAKILKAEGKPDLRRMLIPIGPVGVFGASNFPLAFSVAGGDTISAFAAKCPVVVKGHPAHPGLSEIVGECIVRAAEKSGMPDFVFSLLHGKNEVGEALVKHPKLHAVGFTGSLRAGRALFDLAASREVPIPVYAEMGSVNPLFILPDALTTKTKEIAEGLAVSVTGSMGQLCTKPGLVFVVGNNQEFLDILSKSISNVPQAPMLTEGIRSAFDNGVASVSGVRGVSLLGKAKSENKNFGTPTVLLTDSLTWKSNQSLHHEIFGPVTLVVTCKTLDEATEIASNLEGQLTASIHATEKDLENSSSLMSNLSNKVGRLIFNGYPTGVEVSSPMTHGGPYPSTSFSNSTSVGTEAIKRWLRPITYQNVPNAALPVELQNENKFKIWRMLNDNFTRDPIN